MILNKVNKTIGLLRKLHNILPRSALLTIYNSFIRTHLDYGDIIYDQAYNVSFHQKLELLHYNVCLGQKQEQSEALQGKNYMKNQSLVQKTILLLQTLKQ